MARAISELQTEILATLERGEVIEIYEVPGKSEPIARWLDRTISVATVDALMRRKLLRKKAKRKTSVIYELSKDGYDMVQTLRDKGRII